MGSSLSRNYFTGRGSPYMGKTFKVREIGLWAALNRDSKGEESRLVAFIFLLVRFME